MSIPRPLLALTLLMTVLLTLFTPRGVRAEWELVRLSFTTGWDALPAVVAIERGFFAQEGLVASAIPSDDHQVLMNSLNAGSTDFAAVPQRVGLIMAAAELPVRIVAMNGFGTQLELLVLPDSDIASVADLEGRKIGVALSSEAYPALIRLLNQAELRPSDVEIQKLSPAEMTEAVSARTIDAVFETRHFTSVLLAADLARVVVGAAKVFESIGFIGAGPVVVRQALIDQEPEKVQRFVSAWTKALHYIQQDPGDAAGLLATYLHRQGTPVRQTLAKGWIALRRWDRYAWGKADIDDAAYNGWALREGSILKEAATLETLVDNRFAEKAVELLSASKDQS